MAKTDSAYQQKSHVNASDFFQNMRKKAEKIADEVALERTYKMLDILRHRKIMENVGGDLARWPKWDNSPKGPASKKSYSFWEAQARPNGEYWLINKVTGQGLGIEDFNYPRILATGKGWDSKVTFGKEFNGKVRTNAQGFSTQMPRGLDPWLKRQRHLLNAELIKRIGTIK